jgi:kynurenine formamidase
MNTGVNFDFNIEFSNGGRLQGNDFQLDVMGTDLSDEKLAACLIKKLGLQKVSKVTIHNKQSLVQPDKQQAAPDNFTGKLIDLSHSIEHGMITYKGLPAPIICDYLSRENSRQYYEAGTEFQIGKIEMVTNTGTYLDCPFHRYPDGKDLSQIQLRALADLPAIVIRALNVQEIGIGYFTNKDIRNKAILVHTGWARNWRTDAYFENHPFITAQAATYLADCQVKLVGIDSHNIDDTRTKARPVHSVLLKNEILIVEHMCNLEKLPDEGFAFSAVPPKFSGVGTFPVRAYARLD